MDELATFEQDLEEALVTREAEIQETVIPELKQCYLWMQSSYEALYNVLKKKGLVKLDPYSYEQRISEVTVPSDQPFLESEREKELGIRTAQFMAQLTFVVNYFDFSLENLTLRQLKTLVQFTRYINWQNLGETATQPTTRALAEQVIKVKKGSDQLSANIASDAQEQLSGAARKALAHLKSITELQRERYKLKVRQAVLPVTGLSREAGDPEQAQQKIRSVWPKTMPGQPFARELVMEILSENSRDRGPAIRNSLLERLKTAPKETKKKAAPDLKELLLDAARALAASSRSLEEVVQKLNDNSVILDSRKLSFGEFLQAVWRRLRSRDTERRIYTVEYIDDKTGLRQSEEIRFEEFLSTLSRRARVYNGILSRSGNAWVKLQQTPEAELLQFVTKDLQEMTVILRRVESLDTMFRAEVHRDQRNRLRGVNVELVAMREHVQRARKKNHEYVARYEEMEQLRRLGIDPAD